MQVLTEFNYLTNDDILHKIFYYGTEKHRQYA